MIDVRIVVAAALIGLSFLSDGAHAQACVPNRDARQIIEQGQALPFAEAAARAGIEANQVVDADLCQGGGGYVYRVRLRDGGQTDIPAN
jgi:hypothetical protein